MESTIHDLPRSSFPFTVELWEAGADRRDAPTWRTTVPGPGVMKVPGFGPGTWARISYADGSVEISPPPGCGEAEF